MKVAIITDQHFGARNDSNVFLDYFEKFYNDIFFPTIEKENIKTLLVLGDTFDRRKYVNFYALDRAKKMFFDRLAKLEIEVHMLAGNHDTYFKNTNDVNSPDLLLKEYENINVIDTPQTIHLNYSNDKCDVLMVPWICPENYQDCLTHIKNTKAELCMGHFEIAGFAMHRGMESHDGLNKEIFQKFDMVFSGHYHHRNSDGHIYYLGNPYELTWQDYNDTRGFHLFDVEKRRLEFVENEYRMFERIEYDDRDKNPIDLSKLDLVQKYVKLVVVNKTDYYKFDKFVTQLYTTSGAYDIKVLEDFSAYEEGEIAEDINLEDTLSVLSHYVDSIETDIEKEQLKSYMRSLYTEAVNIEVV